ncbi:protein of unknown function [Aminobacter niigataensis]|nr:protein of unknown function [Aminobacter niigataensis]
MTKLYADGAQIVAVAPMMDWEDR